MYKERNHNYFWVSPVTRQCPSYLTSLSSLNWKMSTVPLNLLHNNIE